MDQRANHIRQDIDTTRASLDAKLNSLEMKARQTFDLNHQVAERPWMALGAAVAAGYVLGSLGSNEPDQRWNGQPMTTTNYTQLPAETGTSSSDRFLAPFDAEIDMLKTAAITTLTNFLHDVIKEYVPALGNQLKSAVQDGLASPPRTSHSSDDDASKAHTLQADRATLNELLTSTPTEREQRY
jgi:hypothetical protein